MTDVTLFGESPFDAIRRTDESGEYWSARELMPLLGYDRWENFTQSVERAKTAAWNSEGEASAQVHFRDARKMLPIGNGAHRNIGDRHLTRFGAYLVAMNGDPRKPEIAAAQTYFAVKTREAETARPSLPDISTPTGVLAMAEQFAATARQLVEATARVAELEPKAAAVDAYMDASEVFLVSEVAKTLKVQEKKLRQHCYDRKILMAHPARRNEPYAQYVTDGYFEIKSRPVEVRGEPRAFNTTYVTTAGVEFLRRSLTRAGLLGDGPRLSLVRPGGVA
jgi:DNA-damage-inducible protein D